MYLVELRPGKEELYRSGDELAAAIRRGDVDVHSRIYHRATSKWISVTLHPQFKAIVAAKAAEPLPALERSQWTYLTDQSETLQGGESAEGQHSGSSDTSSPRHPWRRLFGLGVAGVALVLGVQLAFSGPRPPWAGPSDAGADATADAAVRSAGQRDEPAAEESVISLASTSTAWESKASSEPDREPDPAPAPKAAVVLPRAPKLGLKTLTAVLPAGKAAAAADANSIDGLLARYGRAYDEARQRLESGMRVARVNQLFAPTRLAPDGGLTDTRLALAGVANFIRVYRQQESVIEREFQDSFTVLSKQHNWNTRAARRWYSRGPQKEPAALAALSTRLIDSLDILLGVLDDEAGAYRLGEGTISFENIEASRRYSELRKQISGMIESARSAGADESAGPIGQLLQVVGTTRLPREI